MGAVISRASDACECIWDYAVRPLVAQIRGGSGGHPARVEIRGGSYRIDRVIGEGGFGFVYLAVDRVGGSQVALKRFAIQDPEEQSRLMEEVRIHRSLCPHDNIVTLIESEVKSMPGKPLPEIWVVMDFIDGPSLQTLVNSRMASKQRITRQEILTCLGDVVQALCHMHSQSPPIAHFDVKLDNVLQCGIGGAKLIDFGSATHEYYLCSNAQEVTVAEGELGQRMTLRYRPPESLDLWRKQRADTKADVWSLGVLVYVLIMQDMPFDENPLDVLIGRPRHFRGKPDDVFKAGHSTNALPTDAQDIMQLVMEGMLVADPAMRKDMFAVAEAVAAMDPQFKAPPRPRPGFISAQKNRFQRNK